MSAREQQVAQLIARGLSDKEIAAELVISRRTAEGHVARIRAKLGFANRAHVAAWQAQRPLGAQPGHRHPQPGR